MLVELSHLDASALPSVLICTDSPTYARHVDITESVKGENLMDCIVKSPCRMGISDAVNRDCTPPHYTPTAPRESEHIICSYIVYCVRFCHTDASPNRSVSMNALFVSDLLAGMH